MVLCGGGAGPPVYWWNGPGMRRSCGRAVRRRKSIKRDRGTDGPTDARRGSTAGRRTCDQEVASSISGLRNDSGQVVHTQLPRRRQSSSAYRVVKRGNIYPTDGRTDAWQCLRHGRMRRANETITILRRFVDVLRRPNGRFV